MEHVRDVNVIGHYCGEIDYPHFDKIKISISDGAIWHFNQD